MRETKVLMLPNPAVFYTVVCSLYLYQIVSLCGWRMFQQISDMSIREKGKQHLRQPLFLIYADKMGVFVNETQSETRK